MTVAVLFPLEIATGYLKSVTAALVDGAETGRREPWEGPVKKYVSPLSNMLIISNKKLIEGVANGAGCSDFYPIQCDEGFAPSYDTCKTGLIACNKKIDAPRSFASRHRRAKIKSPGPFASFWQSSLSFFASWA
jgi:hypothetical protein